MDAAFFDGWGALARTVVVGALAYIGLILFLRIAGKRTLTKMNAFDLVVTVALGSSLASILLNKDVALAQGLLAFALLIGLQYAITWTSVRTRWIRHVVTGEPSVLVYRGKPMVDTLRRERISEEELLAAVRANGLEDPAQADIVILETDGSVSVIRDGGTSDAGGEPLAES